MGRIPPISTGSASIRSRSTPTNPTSSLRTRPGGAFPRSRSSTRIRRPFGSILWEIGRKWIDFGIDGWRLDVANEIDDDSFWQEFRRRVRQGNREAYIVGEVWTESTRWLNKGDMWDAVMNYPFTRACIALFAGGSIDEDELRKTSLFPVGPSDAGSFRKNIERLIAIYPWSVTSVMLNLLGSHDMARFVTLARGDQSALRLATLFQMTYPGAPSIYYGDEVGMAGGHDPANRGAFPWHKPNSWDIGLLHEFQRLIALRKAHPALRRGTFTFLHAASDVVAYLRQHGGETFLIAMNVAKATKRVDLDLAGRVPEGDRLDEVFANGSAQVEGGRIRNLELTPRSARIFAKLPPK